VAALLSGRAILFIRDWGAFILVLLAWQVASTLATRFAFPWHLHELIDADKLLFFGHVPTVWLQQHLYQPGSLRPWDVLAATMYMLHFLAPLLAGFALWLADRAMFRKFALAFVLVAIAGFATYILYPSVPPWMAAQALVRVGNEYVPWWQIGGTKQAQYIAWEHSHVYLPGVQNLFNVFASSWYNPYHGNISLTSHLHLKYDTVGAIPSEHAMYPMLFFLFLRKQFGAWGYLVLIYLAAIVFSIVYLGQHYVIDALIGFVYAWVGYGIVMHAAPAFRSWLARSGVPAVRVWSGPRNRSIAAEPEDV